MPRSLLLFIHGLVPLLGPRVYRNERLTHTAPLLPVQATMCDDDAMVIRLAMIVLTLALLPTLCIIALVGRLLGLPTLQITVYLLALE